MPYSCRRASRVLFLVLGLASTACPGGGSASTDAGRLDAAPPPDAPTVPDAAPPMASGHAGAALVPAGAAAASQSYRFVGTLSAGGPAATTQHTVQTGVAGATQ